MAVVAAGNILISVVFINIALMGFIFWSQWKLTDTNTEEEAASLV